MAELKKKLFDFAVFHYIYFGNGTLREMLWQERNNWVPPRQNIGSLVMIVDCSTTLIIKQQPKGKTQNLMKLYWTKHNWSTKKIKYTNFHS
jgi:hypothetical protein